MVHLAFRRAVSLLGEGDARYRRLFLLLLGAVALLSAWTVRDFGVTWDEEGMRGYGDAVLRWYATFFRDRSALTFGNLYLYGGLFELIAQPLGRMPLWAPHEGRHIANVGVALAGVVFTYRLGSLLGGARVGLLSALFLVLTPIYVGHAANNPKDLPFAVGFVAALDAIFRFCRQLPRPRARTTLLTGAMVGLPLGVRAGGMLLFGYLGILGLGSLVLAKRAKPSSAGARALLHCAVAFVTVVAVAWAVMLAAWPWGQMRPLANPIECVITNSHFGWYGSQLFKGVEIKGSEMPWTYLPTWFGMVLPELHFIALGAGIVAVGLRIKQARSRQVLEWSLLVFTVLFPPALAIALRSTLYDGMRHFLFLVPPIAVVSAGGAAMLGPLRAPGAARRAAAVALAASCILTACDIVRLHPYQSAYFNRLVAGGVAEASARFPTDYWCSSFKEAVEWIARSYGSEGAKVQINVCAIPSVVEPFLAQPPAKGRVELGRDRARADLLVARMDDACGRIDGEVVHVIERMGMPLSKVIELPWARTRKPPTR